jgi:hypothetical protein
MGERFSLEGQSVAATVFRTGHAARMVSYENASGTIAARFRDLGLRTAVGPPITVGGADVGKGSGLIGLIDRFEALGGYLEILSPVGTGTLLLGEIPLLVE